MSETKQGPSVGLGIVRKEGESWRDCAVRYGKHYGMEPEVSDAYDEAIRRGESEVDAAWGACIDWDVASIFENGVEKHPL